MTTEINLPTKEELEASTGSKFLGVYAGPLSYDYAENIVYDFKHKKHRNAGLLFPDVQIVKQDDGFNAVYRNVPNSWVPTGNPILDKFVNLFGEGKRTSELGYDIYDGFISTELGCESSTAVIRRFMPTSFYNVEGWADYPYREIWLSDELLAKISFCEGDVTLATCPNIAVYKAMIKSAHNFYVGDTPGYYNHSFLPEKLPIAQAAIAELPKLWKQPRLYGTDTHAGYELLTHGESPTELLEFAKEWFKSSDRTIHSSCRLQDARGGSMTFSRISFEREPENVEQTIKNWEQGETNENS